MARIGHDVAHRLASTRPNPFDILLVHAHLRVDRAERDQWLACMVEAMIVRQLLADLQRYPKWRFAVPAKWIRSLCERRHGEA